METSLGSSALAVVFFALVVVILVGAIVFGVLAKLRNIQERQLLRIGGVEAIGIVTAMRAPVLDTEPDGRGGSMVTRRSSRFVPFAPGNAYMERLHLGKYKPFSRLFIRYRSPFTGEMTETHYDIDWNTEYIPEDLFLTGTPTLDYAPPTNDGVVYFEEPGYYPVVIYVKRKASFLYAKETVAVDFTAPVSPHHEHFTSDSYGSN